MKQANHAFGLTAGGQGGRSLDASKLEAAYIGFRTLLHKRLATNGGIGRKLATVIETDNVLDRQVWLANTPKMRRWVGDKNLHKLRAESHPIATTPHEASIEVPKNDILNDRLGMYRDRINNMADAYEWAIDEMVVTFLAAGVAGTALGATYDGQNLIDTDHTSLSIGGTNQTNKVTGALSATTFATARRRFLELVDENGVPLNTAGRRMKLVVGPANEDIALDILVAKTLSSGAENVDFDTADLVVTPWLTGRTVNVLGVSVTITGTEWFYMPENSTSVLLHVKRGPEFLSVEEGEFPFRTGKYLYGIEAEFGAGYGLWQEIVGGPGV